MKHGLKWCYIRWYKRYKYVIICVCSVCVYLYVCMCVYIYIWCMYTCIRVHIYYGVCICMYIYMVYVYIYTYICSTYIYVYIYTHVVSSFSSYKYILKNKLFGGRFLRPSKAVHPGEPRPKTRSVFGQPFVSRFTQVQQGWSMDWFKGKLKPESPIFNGKIYGFL